MTKLVLIWNCIPDDVTIYLVEVDSAIGRLAVESAGFYINSDNLDEDHPIFKLNDMIEVGSLAPYKVDGSICYNDNISIVVECGMVC